MRSSIRTLPFPPFLQIDLASQRMIVEPLTAFEDILARRVLPIELVDLLEILFPGLDLLAALVRGSFIVAGFLIVTGGLEEGILVGRGERVFHFVRSRGNGVGRRVLFRFLMDEFCLVALILMDETE